MIARAGSLAISFSTVRARGKPWLCHGFLPTNRATSACSKSARIMRAEHLAVHPELAGLLLRQRVGPVLGAERPQRGAAVAATEMVPLPATAVVEDRLAAVGVAHRGELLGDLADRGVPVDLLERAVVAAPQRRGQPRLVLVVVEPQAPSHTCSPATRGAPCRRGSARTGCPTRHRGAPRCRSCTRTGCKPSGATRQPHAGVVAGDVVSLMPEQYDTAFRHATDRSRDGCPGPGDADEGAAG